MLRLLTAGESHGKCLTGILEGLPGGLAIDPGSINLQLHRRQVGYGRGERMQLEQDTIEITAGVRHGRTIGSPISFVVQNKDWVRWSEAMSSGEVAEGTDLRAVSRPRPGHADLAGALKFLYHDARNILERASARETTARVAAGAFCLQFLAHFGIGIGSHVIAIGSERVGEEYQNLLRNKIMEIDPASPLRCADPEAQNRMMALIDEARSAGDSLGGVLEVVAGPVPPGLGSHVQWDKRLDGHIAQALMSIPSAKGVEIGSGVTGAGKPGSAFHDEIFFDERAKRFVRKTNRAGGLEGGISNGEDIRARVYLKPIPTLMKPLATVDLQSKDASEAVVERSDVCVVPAAGVIAEAMLGFVLARAFLEKFGGDSLAEVEGNHSQYLRSLGNF